MKNIIACVFVACLFLVGGCKNCDCKKCDCCQECNKKCIENCECNKCCDCKNCNCQKWNKKTIVLKHNSFFVSFFLSIHKRSSTCACVPIPSLFRGKFARPETQLVSVSPVTSYYTSGSPFCQAFSLANQIHFPQLQQQQALTTCERLFSLYLTQIKSYQRLISFSWQNWFSSPIHSQTKNYHLTPETNFKISEGSTILSPERLRINPKHFKFL